MNTVEPTPPRTSRAFAFASGGIALAAAALLAVGLLGSGGQSASAQTGSPTVEETSTASPEATPSPSAEASPSPTEDASPSPSVEASPSPTEDASPSPSATASPSASPSASPTASPSPGATKTYILEFRWSLLGWLGANNTPVIDALTNNLSDDGDLSDDVTALYSWDSANQKWLGWFPGADDIPGANDFTVFTNGQAFWIAIAQDQDLTWTIPLP